MPAAAVPAAAVPAWRLVLDTGAADGPVPDGARNMAVDHALLTAVRGGATPVVRFYRWRPACLSFGRNQHTAGIYDEARIRAAGLDLVRRPTGGLAVLHDDELTYSVAAPAARLGGPRAGYALINAALVDGLRRLGVPAAVSGAGPAPDPRHDTAAPCFQAPAPGEVVAAGRKLVGSAQRCEHRTVLQHGSILLGGSQDRIGALLRSPAAASSAAGAATGAGSAHVAHGGGGTGARESGSITLAALLGAAPGLEELVAALRLGFETVFGIPLALGPLTAGEEADAAALEATYRSAAWTWRR